MMVQLARAFRADGILVGAVTHYQPYSPPRIGMTLQLVSPSQAVVVASVDGLWDGRHKNIADSVRAYYDQVNHPLLGLHDESDLALASPLLFQRFVCNQAAQALVNPGPVRPPPPPVSDVMSDGKSSGSAKKMEGDSP
jgi:hypothetical protein